jgi:DNA primase
LRENNVDLYNQYNFERFDNQPADPIVVPKKPIAVINDNLAQLVKISNLNSTHLCKKYIVSRQIPTDYHYKLYYCAKFKQWVNTTIADKFKQTDSANPRLVIPFLDHKEKMFGFQGRALYESKAKYITIMLDEYHPRIFGLDTVDYNRRYYCFEGPIDSMYINNAVASAGGKIDSELGKAGLPKEHCVVVYDNEPRNSQIIKNMLSATQKQYKVVVWPPSFQYKDVNDYIVANINKPYVDNERVRSLGDKLRQLIDDNTFSGLSAELAISQWRQAYV